MSRSRSLARFVAGAGALLGAYALYEPRRFRLTSITLPTRAALGLTVLHVSDTHLLPRNRPLARFLESLPGLLPEPPDLVLATGDLIDGNEGIEPIARLLAPLEGRFGRFYVLGSHDYFLSERPAPTKYFTNRRPRRQPPRAETERLEALLADKGWVALTNRSVDLDTPSGRIRLAGVDDPYLRWHRTDHIERDVNDDLAIGLVHSPELVSEWLLHGFDLVVAGHTHGGQVRIPGIGAVVTNSSLPNALAMGPHRIGRGWLHVSPGLGAGRFTPIRFACRPEATLLRLVPKTSLGL